MKPFLGFLFLLVNIFSTSTGKSNIVIASILLCICISYIYVSKKKGNGLLVSLVELLCYTWSSSWRNIFGGSFESMPIPWFYLIGLMILLYIIFRNEFKVQKGIFILLWLLITLGIIELAISPGFSEAMTEYITVLFLYLVIGAVQFSKITIEENEYFSMLKSFVYAMLISSIFIILQFAIQSFTGYDFLSSSETVLLGGRRMMNTLLFGDISSATICLGIGVIIIIMDFKRFKHPYLISSLIIGGMTLSSARTGFITLIITSIIYIVFAKNTVNKIKVTIVSALAGVIGIIAYFTVRKVSSLDVLLSDNGRFVGYILAVQIWAKNPIFGVGFGDGNLSLMMQMPVPHFSLLKILTQTGIVYFLCLLALLIYYYIVSKRSIYHYGKYMFINTMIGSLFIPGIFSARFLTVILVIIILQEKIVSSKSLQLESNIEMDKKLFRK